MFVLVNFYLKISNISKPYVTKTAGEFIFDGYHDPVLDILDELQKHIPHIPINLPFKKVGWFYGVINISFKLLLFFLLTACY